MYGPGMKEEENKKETRKKPPKEAKITTKTCR